MERAAAVRPTDYQSAMLLPQLYAQLGDDEQARRWSREGLERARRHLDLQPDDYRAMYLSAGALLNLGDPEAGRELMDRAMTLGGDESGVLYNAACFYARSGDPERALDCLERSPVVGRLPVREWMENDHDLVSLRGHPRFNALLDRAGPDQGSDDASDGSA